LYLEAFRQTPIIDELFPFDVIAGLDPAIHRAAARWMPASSAGMTVKKMA